MDIITKVTGKLATGSGIRYMKQGVASKKAIGRIASRLVSMEFPTQSAYNTYMKAHPDADKSNHSVKKSEPEFSSTPMEDLVKGKPSPMADHPFNQYMQRKKDKAYKKHLEKHGNPPLRGDAFETEVQEPKEKFESSKRLLHGDQHIGYDKDLTRLSGEWATAMTNEDIEAARKVAEEFEKRVLAYRQELMHLHEGGKISSLDRIAARLVASPVKQGEVYKLNVQKALQAPWAAPEWAKLVKALNRRSDGWVTVEKIRDTVADVYEANNPAARMLGTVQVPVNALDEE